MNPTENSNIIRSQVADASLRFGDWGPGYLLDSETCRIGIVRLRPGDEVENHLHAESDESFIVVSGKAELWVDREQQASLVAGDIAQCKVGHEHFLRAFGEEMFEAYFIKSPAGGDDTRAVPWTPESN
ncbi:cupin domain-containing protein [Leucobacter sp. gxy201]|uniref:cupin domain-containing protein n=1 Tax=Leucobacter sp. gxy201 TaxID=2957200 RepID=UPI003DA0DD86